MAARIAMIAITIRSSIKVKKQRPEEEEDVTGRKGAAPKPAGAGAAARKQREIGSDVVPNVAFLLPLRVLTGRYGEMFR